MIQVHAQSPGSQQLIGFTAYAHRLLEETVQEGLELGEHTMTSIVPRGQSNRLASAVGHVGPITAAPGHYFGTVGVDPVIAPHAEKVNRGTGVDGPFRTPSVVLRPSRTGKPGRGVHQFTKLGEPTRYRKTVKAAPSLKIQHGKNFVDRTHNAMVDWARIRTGVLAGQLALYFVERRNK